MKKILQIIGIIIIFVLLLIGIIYLINMDKVNDKNAVWLSNLKPDSSEENELEQNTENKIEGNIATQKEIERMKIEDLPQDYSYIQAIKDKCVISSQGIKIFNKDELDTFLNKVDNNEPYSIRTISYTDEGDMIITDINYEGNNIFSTYCDWTRDKFSSKEDRIYRYGKFSKLVIDDEEGETRIYLDGKIEGDIEQANITYINKNAKVINNYESKYLLNVKRSKKVEVKKITQGELAKKYKYDIYYYGLEDITVQINNEEIDLKQALIDNKVTMEQIIEQADKDKENDVIFADMYKDGGSMQYWYGEYTIIKSHSLDGNGDVYIGIPEMNFNSVR